MEARQAFNFYVSFDEVFQELNTNQKGIMIDAILSVQFMRVYIDDIKFKDKILSIVWKGMKHSILKQVDGFCRANKTAYNRELLGCEANTSPTPKADITPTPMQVQEKGKVQGKEEEQEEFTFSLSTQKLLSSTSKEYQSKLKEYILNSGKQMSYEDFYNQCEMKPYKYKNFKMAYDKWNSGKNIIPDITKPYPPKSFKQQDKETSRNKVNAYLESGYSLRGNSEHLEVEVITHDN